MIITTEKYYKKNFKYANFERQQNNQEDNLLVFIHSNLSY